MNGVCGYLEFEIGGELEYRHKKTGALLHMVAEMVAVSDVDDEGDVFEYEYEHRRPAKWYKPENVEVVHLDPTRYRVAMFD